MKLSIITINRNNKLGLVETIKSVLFQSFHDMEYIIVDGASTDGSFEEANKFISKTRTSIPVNIKSEPDKGIYNAMNKGVSRANGEFVLFINSGDILCESSVLEKAFSSIKDDPSIVIGRVNLLRNGSVISKDVGYSPGEHLTLSTLYLLGIPHQGAIIKRSLLKKHPYDEHYKINSDWKFFLQTIIMDNETVQIIPVTIANYDTSGISSMNKELLSNERILNFKEVIPERISEEYIKFLPHYYEAKRIEWLLRHRFFYVIYRYSTTLGMKLFK